MVTKENGTDESGTVTFRDFSGPVPVPVPEKAELPSRSGVLTAPDRTGCTAHRPSDELCMNFDSHGRLNRRS
jgi:hypothetical protein